MLMYSRAKAADLLPVSDELFADIHRATRLENHRITRTIRDLLTLTVPGTVSSC